MAQGTEAYDLTLFAPRRPRLQEVPKPQQAHRGGAQRTKLQSLILVLVTLAGALLLAAALGFGIYMKMQIAQTNDQIASLREELKEQENEAARLQGQLAEQTSTAQVESWAREHGMQPLEAYQIHYISLEDNNKVRIGREAEKSWWDKLFE